MEHQHMMRDSHAHSQPIISRSFQRHAYDSTDKESRNCSGHSDHTSMAFHFGVVETILFKFWVTTNVWAMVASCVIVCILGVLYEGLKYYRAWLFKKQAQRATTRLAGAGASAPTFETYNFKRHHVGGVVGTIDNPNNNPSILSSFHFYQTLLHMLQVTMSFLLMLIFMTFNVWLCLAVVLGAGIGYFLFFWQSAAISQEHCN